MTMRLDKWLWCARYYKTRKLAIDAIKSGKVQINESKLKPSHTVHEGVIMTVRRGHYSWEIKILALAKNRLSSKDAHLLYEESQQSILKRQMLSSQLELESKMYPRSQGRPTKRQRRDLQKFNKRSREPLT